MATREPFYRFDTRPDVSTSTIPGPIAPIIDRRELDTIRPYFFYILAFGAFLLSATSTVLQTATILHLMNINVAIFGMYAVGASVAAVITLGELMTNESWWYLAFLIPDVALTIWWIIPAFAAFATNTGLPLWSAYACATTVGIISAYLPERVLLGARRRGRVI